MQIHDTQYRITIFVSKRIFEIQFLMSESINAYLILFVCLFKLVLCAQCSKNFLDSMMKYFCLHCSQQHKGQIMRRIDLRVKRHTFCSVFVCETFAYIWPVLWIGIVLMPIWIRIPVQIRFSFDADLDLDPNPDLDPAPNFTHVEKSECFWLLYTAVLHCFSFLVSVIGVKNFNFLASILKVSGKRPI